MLNSLEEYISSFCQDKKFDVILAWDFFNYVDRSTMEWVIRRLSQHCRPNALLHMVRYLGRNIPAAPQHYQILDQYQVKLTGQDLWCSRPFPAIDTTSMLKAMTGYGMEHTYLQQEGMVQNITEQVFRYMPEGKISKRREGSAELPIHAGISSALESHRSYGFELLCDHLKKMPSPCVLDLGSKVTRSSDFLNEYAEQVYVEDLAPSLIPSSTSDEPVIRQHALLYDKNVKFDVIFAWDLFNFTSAKQLEEIYRRLLPHIHSATKIFAFFYTGSELPSRPQKCYLVDNKNIALLPAPKKNNEGNELSAVSLLKVFERFNLAQTYILRPGMHRGIYEYIFQAR